MERDFYTTHLHLQKASDRALVASRDAGPHFFANDMIWLRRYVERALSRCDVCADEEVIRADLLDLIETAITDSHDLDSTDRDAADSVLRALLDNIAPLPVKQEAAA